MCGHASTEKPDPTKSVQDDASSKSQEDNVNSKTEGDKSHECIKKPTTHQEDVRPASKYDFGDDDMYSDEAAERLIEENMAELRRMLEKKIFEAQARKRAQK